MIEAKHLRIGNLVQRKRDKTVVEVLEVLANRISYNNPDLSLKSISADLSNFEPILTNYEWASKIGFSVLVSQPDRYTLAFIDSQDKRVGLTLFFKNHLELDKVSIAFKSEKVSIVYLDKYMCKYVHRVQNLWFSLTGEEIAIDPEYQESDYSDLVKRAYMLEEEYKRSIKFNISKEG